MTGLRLWHGMIAVIAAAVLFTAVRYESPCTPVSPILALLYLCGVLGIDGARRQERRGRTGLLLGLLLGPIGVILACSHRVPDGWTDCESEADALHPTSDSGGERRG